MIEARDLHVRVQGRPLLRGASLRAERGEVVLLEGASGSGKTTLLRTFLGLAPRTPATTVSGSLRVAGFDALATPTAALARHVGLLFQDPAVQLAQADVASELVFRAENLGLPWRDVDARAEEAAGKYGLGPLLERPVAALSGGERKRLALAALETVRPGALLLDEPLGGLDADWRSRVVPALRHADRATLVVEHRASDLRPLRPRRLHLAEGRVAATRPEPSPRRRTPARRLGSPPLVVAQDVTLRKGDHDVLRGASFDAGPGVTLLLGANGAGKTSLFRALLGLERVEGTVRLAGLDPQREPLHRIARVAGYVPQRAEDLFTASSVREELGAEGSDLLAPLGLGGLLARHPFTLSGGEQQRLALACALAHRPRVALLDEPTVGLDAAGLAQVLEALRAVRPDTAFVVATHDAALLDVADAAVELADGRVARPRRTARVLEVAR